MDLNIEDISQGKLHNKVTFLLQKIKLKNKKSYDELIEIWEDAELDEVKDAYMEILRVYKELC